jgi:hypothetical protein
MVNGEDDFTRERECDHREVLWRVELTDGSVIVQDDGRPGMEPPSAWMRLQSHLNETGLGIRKMWVQFRTNHVHCLPADAEGYFFCKSALGMLSGEESFSFYLLGHLQDEKVVVQHWKVPELILLDVEFRDPTLGPCLIRNPNYVASSTA